MFNITEIRSGLNDGYISPNIQLKEMNDIKDLPPIKHILDNNIISFRNFKIDKYKLLKHIITKIYCYQPRMTDNILIKGNNIRPMNDVFAPTNNGSKINTREQYTVARGIFTSPEYIYNGHYIMKF